MFIKYGCIRDEKFFEKVKEIIVYKDLDGKYITLSEYLDGKSDKTVYYVSDEAQQSQYINMFRQQGENAVFMSSMIDIHFISFMEMKEDGVKFKRIDSFLADDLKESDSADEEANKSLIEKTKKFLGSEDLKVEVQSLKDKELPAVVLLGEESRRMQEMYKSYGQQFAGMSSMFKDDYTFVLNSNNELVKKLDSADEETAKLITNHIYDLAMMSLKPLGAEQMTKFIERSNMLLGKLL